MGAEAGEAAGSRLPWPADRLHELREVFSTPHSCDSTIVIPGGFLKITWMKQKTAEQGAGRPWRGGRANSAFPWGCSMINRDKERKERRKLINTTGTAARLCLSQVITALTSCLEKRTGNKSGADKICLREGRCTRMTQPCWGSPKKLFPPLFLGLKPASMGTSHLVLLSPSCSCHPTPGKSSSKGSSRWGELISCQVISPERTLGSWGWAPGTSALLMDAPAQSRASPTLRDLDPEQPELELFPTLQRGSKGGMGALGSTAGILRHLCPSWLLLGQVWEQG